MHSLRTFSLVILGAAVSCGASAWGAPPLKLDAVGSAVDLAAEAAAKGTEIETQLASADAYQEATDKVRQSASLLAVLGQALAEHPQDSPLKKSGPDLRDAAIVIARAKTYEDAKAALPKLQAALKGESSGAAAEFNWAKLTRMHPAMEEMNQRSSQLRRVLRRPKDPAADSRHALAIAVLAVATHADTHEVKNPADTPKWHAFAAQLQQHFSDTAAKIQAKDTAAANTAFLAGMATCKECHEVFHNE